MKGKAKEILDDLVMKITSDTVARYVNDTLFADDADIPCRKWSDLNRFSVVLAGTNDARGIRQWNKVGRRVKKGAHAFYIFVPLIYPAKQKNQGDSGETDEETEQSQDDDTKIFFKLMPVFRVEDTEGAPLDYETKIKSFDVSSLPLIEVAKSLGVTVAAGLTLDCAGSYRPKTKHITLGSTNPQVFLHELSHAVDYTLPNRKENDYAFGEVIAELSSAFLGSLYGVKVDIGSTKAYIESWSGKGHVAFKVMEALKRVEEIYHYIESVTKKPHRTSKPRAPKPIRPLPVPVTEYSDSPDEVAGDECLFSQLPPFRNRTQTFNPKNGRWVKRDEKTGLFRSVKKDGKPYRRVLQEAGTPIIEFPVAMQKC
ncbi:hypothetical protein FACS1894172_02900 [Spirochaetia bacterium]|nr:hypothetical protein FACS1894172_02900 [Spirochaetia bacterium]